MPGARPAVAGGPFRQLLSGLAYTLFERLRCRALRAPLPIRCADTAKNRHGHRLQQTPNPHPAEQCLSASGSVPQRGPASEHLIAHKECCPGTLINSGGWGSCVRRTQKDRKNRQNPINQTRLIKTAKRKVEITLKQHLHATLGLASRAVGKHLFDDQKWMHHFRSLDLTFEQIHSQLTAFAKTHRNVTLNLAFDEFRVFVVSLKAHISPYSFFISV